MTTTNHSRAAVRVCEIADIECSRNCGTGPCKRETSPVEQHEAAPADTVLCARMGHGVVSIADCFNPELQEPGLIFMELSEPHEIGTDTGDVFPEGSRAPIDKTLAYVSFANGAAVDQTIEVLQRIKANYFTIVPLEGTGNGADYQVPYIERFSESDGEGGGVYPDRNGNFVRYSDFVALSRAPRTEVAGAVPQPIGPHDVTTSAGGRGYIAEFFAKRLCRHDFGRYIDERLAADFACALAKYLMEHDTSPSVDAAAAPADERAAFVKAVQSLAFLCRTEPSRLDGETLAALARVEDHLVDMGESTRDDDGELRAAASQPAAAAGQEAVAIPAGYALVPIEPTVEMLMFTYDPGTRETPSERYAALLAAAPQPPAPQVPSAQAAGLTDDVCKLIEAAAECISEAVTYEQDGFDSPPQPASQWDYNADQLAYALRALLNGANHE